MHSLRLQLDPKLNHYNQYNEWKIVMKSRKMVICIIITALAILVWLVYFRYIPSQENVNISHIQLKSNINRIAKSYTNIFANCEIWDVNDKLRFTKDNISVIDNMNEDQRIISIGGGDDITENSSFKEIYGIFESWLFVKDKKIPYDVIAICWSYTSGGIYTTTDKTTIITKSEFELIYENTDTARLNRKQAAQALANKWIKETGYVK